MVQKQTQCQTLLKILFGKTASYRWNISVEIPENCEAFAPANELETKIFQNSEVFGEILRTLSISIRFMVKIPLFLHIYKIYIYAIWESLKKLKDRKLTQMI